ncbi:hypothetical protein E5676_scaffold121G00130 [Cucumis melo var. makuwa]|uniref:Uncharacterized protein n=1 Tax=Cucumis melo var. makuwa TaxID=1194695 RepID=A0A5D3BWF6_CUCMM|nr:hypothetical protein E6C27_scaffold269G001010 [Cucumis melo var. makuwa]TYK03415.1 hypothetical protein E5676_scaffold121G00130 [Cucumis melo var. makuwa]
MILAEGTAMGIPDVPPLVYTSSFLNFFVHLLFDSTIEEVGNSKTSVTKPTERLARAPFKIFEPSLDTSKRQIVGHLEPSQWVGEKVISNFFLKTTLWIAKIHADDLTPLEEYLNSYLKKDKVNTLESTYAITEEAIEALCTVHKSMEVAREEFKNFKWKL